MPETTRRPLIEVAKRFGIVACVSGRRASDARRVVSLGSIAYLGSHGAEILHPGSIAPEMGRELQAGTRGGGEIPPRGGPGGPRERGGGGRGKRGGAGPPHAGRAP